MVEAIVKKTTPPENRREAYRKPNGRKLEGSPLAKGKRSIKVEQCGTPPYVDIVKELATPISVVNKEVYVDRDTVDRDTTHILRGETKVKMQVNKFYHVPLDANLILGCVTLDLQSILFLTQFMLKFMRKFPLVFLSQLMLLLSLQIRLIGSLVASLKMSIL
jgi:hypothetical protein